MNWRYSLPALALLCAMNLPAQAAVTATLNKNSFASGETIQLQLQRDGSADSQPDIRPLKQDFDVLGSSSGSNVQIINGHMSTQTQITLLLSPKRSGKLQIPPLQWGGEQSAAIEINVGGTAAGTANGGQPADDNTHVFITTTLDQKQPYVQAAVVLTVRLYTEQSLLQAGLDLPASSDVLVKQLGKDLQTTETRNGRNYQVVERKYLLFPQRSGKLSLQGPVLDAQVADNSAASNDPFDNIFGQSPFGRMLNATRPLRVRGKQIELNVLPRPAAATGANWLPAQKVTLDESWKPEAAGAVTMHVGEPLTRHFSLTALGLTAAQLPDPNSLMSLPEGIKAYPDQATLTDSPQGLSVQGSREQNIALIASAPGRYALPAVHLSWWDTLHNEQREITLPARTLNVLPAAAGATNAPMPQLVAPAPLPFNQQPAAQAPAVPRFATHPAWMWLSMLLALLWLGTLVMCWRQRVPRTQKIKAAKKTAPLRSGSELNALLRACSNNDAQAARRHLLAWAGTLWPDAAPRGLNELAHKFSDAGLVEALRQLDRACYTNSDWDGTALAQSLPAGTVAAAGKAPAKRELPSLYE